ncbi:MAG: ring-cleaving dioxygenase [Gemmatimonadales bacterium]|nr:ring-cleaving dioxygenase [Gemmatimonadales bacterium]
MSGITGIHHITAIAGDAQENLDFYVGVLGMRLVKRSVNQDAPGTYHLFYADADGHPGADITFFPWPGMEPIRKGTGLGAEIGLAVPTGTLDWWARRLSDAGVLIGARETRRGEGVLPFTDPHGLELALAETSDPREFTAWDRSPVPEDHQVIGLHSVRLVERELAPTAAFLTGVLGFHAMGEENGWHRFGLGAGGSGRHVEVQERPAERRGQWGVGAMHHVAWRVPDDETEVAVQEQLLAANGRPTGVIDRFWFKSVYFKEPGGVLFEIATDGPGFSVDEYPGTLGEKLVLPPWLEADRPSIRAGLPSLRMPALRGA